MTDINNFSVQRNDSSITVKEVLAGQPLAGYQIKIGGTPYDAGLVWLPEHSEMALLLAAHDKPPMVMTMAGQDIVRQLLELYELTGGDS